MTSTHLETALLALNVGLSPVPPLENGTKAPICSWKAPDQAGDEGTG